MSTTHPRPSAAAQQRREANLLLLRARDAMDRAYAEALDIDALARIALVSPAHFIRTFRQAFGETPHRYLQRRRIERAMALLRAGEEPVTEVALAVGFTSLGTFGRTFRDIVGQSPTEFRRSAQATEDGPAPTCYRKTWERPRERRPPGGA